MGRTYRQRRHKEPKNKGCKQQEYAIANLSQFCVSHGCNEVRHLRTYDFNGFGRGLQTLTKINPGDAIIRLPLSLLITTSVALRDERIRDAVQSSTLKPTAVELLSAFLLYEKKRGDNSFWRYYIDSLPTSFTTLLCMNSDDITLLDHRLQIKLKKMQMGVNRTFSEMMNIFSELLGKISYEEYLWAWHVVNTRCIYMKQPTLQEVRTSADEEDDFALAPFLDLLNHSPSANSTISCGSGEGYCTIQTQDTYDKYDQVFIKYGSHTNRFLLLEYGFSIPNKRDEYVEFDIDTLIGYVWPECKTTDGFKDTLEDWKLTKGLLCDYSEGLSWNALNAIKVVCDSSGGAVSEREGRMGVLFKAAELRLSLIEKISTVKSSAKRTVDELFVLDMLTVLYKEEVAILKNAEKYI